MKTYRITSVRMAPGVEDHAHIASIAWHECEPFEGRRLTIPEVLGQASPYEVSMADAVRDISEGRASAFVERTSEDEAAWVQVIDGRYLQTSVDGALTDELLRLPRAEGPAAPTPWGTFSNP